MSSRPSVAVIVNPAKFEGTLDRVERDVADALRGAGGPVPTFLETTKEDPGHGQARRALDAGATLVCALGGDGTVRSVAEAVAGTGVPLGLLPGGTGNLLARNLGVPYAELRDAVEVAWTGADRTIDVGWAHPEGGRREAFVVMAGLGFDAAVMDDAPEGLKETVGWGAYVLAGLRNLRGEPFDVRLDIDGRASRFEARTVVVGNCGTLQGGIRLIPEAQVDDGLLDAVVLTPDGAAGWAATAADILRQKEASASSTIDRATGAHLLITVDPPQKVELDGDVLEPTGRLELSVDAGALVVRVPAT